MMKDGWGRGCPASLIIICSLEWIYTTMINGSYPESEGMIIKFAIFIDICLNIDWGHGERFSDERKC